MPPLASSGSETSGKNFRRSNTEMRRKSKNDDDDSSIRFVGEPKMSNRRKVSSSSTPIFLLQIYLQSVVYNVSYPCQLIQLVAFVAEKTFEKASYN